ncbi:ABC transporter permease subunit [Streptomyces coriariae]|uniref:ABC transporter permease subunit n=1 Tax=Streptomyces coriariae TaxID=2864460 RepID=UPI001E39750E|nr:ABC transporter permease subunit [Streptomyces coriariae]
MGFTPALHAEWIKIRTLRPLVGGLCAMLSATLVFSGFSVVSASSADAATGSGGEDLDPLFSVLFGVSFGQIAAIAFATTAVSSEFHGGALRLSLAAVPHRGRWFAAKLIAIALPVLTVGLTTGLITVAVGSAVLGERADGLGTVDRLRGALGCGLYLTLMALLAAGLTAVLRSGTAALSILVPFLLIVSFVVGDMSGDVADLLPDRAGQVVLHSRWEGPLGPWTGLGVTALWTATAVVAGAWRIRRRDA